MTEYDSIDDVVEAAYAAAKRRGYCNEFDAIMDELGLKRPVPELKVGGVFPVDEYVDKIPPGTVVKAMSGKVVGVRANDPDNDNNKWLTPHDGCWYYTMAVGSDLEVLFVPPAS